MAKYNVHLYPTVVVKFSDIDRDSPAEAVAEAMRLYNCGGRHFELGEGLRGFAEWIEDANGPFDLPLVDVIDPETGETEEAETYPRADWQYEITNGDTALGYEEWIKHKIEADIAERV